jgi:pre-mRNA cleavage complex 2 protein Pcf11
MSIATDPDAFARMYNSHLASLTFNSKPIITNLTVMAHEHVQQMANVVARCLDEHIVQVSI